MEKISTFPEWLREGVSLLGDASTPPANSSQFLDLNGVGESKLEKYGDIFLEALSGFELGA